MAIEKAVEQKVIKIKTEYEARSDYKKLKLASFLLLFFSFLFSFLSPVVSMTILSIELFLLYLFYSEYLSSKKVIYKLLMMPKISKEKYINIGYLVYEEELDGHLNVLEDNKKLAQKQKIMKKEKERQVGFDKSHMTTHFWILGATGAGKTEYILNLIENTIKKGGGCLFVDGKAETVIFKKLYAIAKKYGREKDVWVLNFLTDKISMDTNTFNPLSFSSAVVREFLFNLLGEASGDQAYWQERGKKMMIPIIEYLVYTRDYLKNPFTYKELLALTEISMYTKMAVHVNLLALKYEKKLRELEQEEEVIKKATRLYTPVGTFGYLNSLAKYLITYPFEKTKLKKIDGDRIIKIENLMKVLTNYMGEITSAWSDFVKSLSEDIFKKMNYDIEDMSREEVLEYLNKYSDDIISMINKLADNFIQHNYAQQQLAKAESMFSSFAHIFGAIDSEINIPKIIKNNQILYVALPALKQAAKTNETLGRLIISAVRASMSIALDERLSLTKTQAKIRNTAIKSNPLYLLIFDEYGSYASNIINDIIAQARSLRFSVNVATQDYTSAKGIDGKDEHSARRLWANTQKIVLKILDSETIEKIEKEISELAVISPQKIKEGVISQAEGRIEKTKLIDVKKLKNFKKGFGLILSDYPFPVLFQSYYTGSPLSDIELIHLSSI